MGTLGVTGAVVVSLLCRGDALAREIRRDATSVARDQARMAAAVRSAGTVLRHGRDTYGKKHSPLIVDGLNVDTMEPPERIQSWSSGDEGGLQPWISSNLGDLGNLMRFLAGLSDLTGEPKYKNAVKAAIQCNFDVYQGDSGAKHEAVFMGQLPVNRSFQLGMYGDNRLYFTAETAGKYRRIDSGVQEGRGTVEIIDASADGEKLSFCINGRSMGSAKAPGAMSGAGDMPWRKRALLLPRSGRRGHPVRPRARSQGESGARRLSVEEIPNRGEGLYG